MFNPALNAALQQWQSPALTLFFQIVTALAYAPILIAVLSMLYWGWNKRTAFGLIQLLIYGCLIENILKETFHTPRPFQVAPGHVRLFDYFMRLEIAGSGVEWGIPARTSFSFPSGHAMLAVVFYGAMALHARRRWATVGAGIVIATIGLSRLYLGCHFLGDVLGGALAGGVVLAVYAMILWLDNRKRWLPSREMTVFLIFAAPVALFFCLPDASSATRLGFLLGFGAGYFAEKRWLRFSPCGRSVQQTARLMLGVAILAGLYFLSNSVLSYFTAEGSHLAYPVVRNLLRYGILGLAASWAIPMLFIPLRLTERIADTAP
jgi:membrane-associated phospholipid phosphatase